MTGPIHQAVFASWNEDYAPQSGLVHRHHLHPDAQGFFVLDGSDGRFQPQNTYLGHQQHVGGSLVHQGGGRGY